MWRYCSSIGNLLSVNGMAVW